MIAGMKLRNLPVCLALGAVFALAGSLAAAPPDGSVYPIQQGYVDAHGVMIYYMEVGRGAPLMIVHGGPGASHDYFLPYLLPLARDNRLVFIDERGSGRSQKLLDDPAQYTVATMNEVFREMKARMAPALRRRIDAMEKAGLFGKGPIYRRGRYSDDFMIAAWGEGYFPYLYQNHPDPNYDPVGNGVMSWTLYREMWGSDGEFVIDGNLKSVEYTGRLPSIRVPTLIMVGDHDECPPKLAEVMHAKIAGSQLVILPRSGHMEFVDQPRLFNATVDGFLHP